MVDVLQGDRTRADVEASADLPIAHALRRQANHLELLLGEGPEEIGVVDPGDGPVTEGGQLGARPVAPRRGAEPGERRLRERQLLVGRCAAPLPPQPLPVDEAGPSDIERVAPAIAAGETRQRRLEVLVNLGAGAEQCSAPGSQRSGGARTRRLRPPLETGQVAHRQVRPAPAHRRLNVVGDRPDDDIVMRRASADRVQPFTGGVGASLGQVEQREAPGGQRRVS